ncbi:unnamed protein product [Urochloa decumbens]|uniref:Uncharacterized protein n=1 Tax=Urochloa decumbens TaxID=240449 RepID=A0ABC9CF06_9POAL
MLVTLLLIAVGSTISISLAPAHISFSIEEASIGTYKEDSKHPDNVTNTHLNFILAANNTSRHTAVRYGSMSVEVWYGPAATAWVRTVVNAGGDGEWHMPGSSVNFTVSADYGYSPNNTANNDCRVVVESKVWFRNGLATTLPFTVSFSCWHVDFVYRPPNLYPIRCVV